MEKKKRKKSFKKSTIKTVSMDLNTEILDQIILYIFINPDSNPYVTRKYLANIYELFRMIDKTPYEEDEVMIARIRFIQKVLHMELKENIFTYELLLSNSLEGSHKEEIQNSIIPFLNQNYELTMEEVKYINKFVSDRLQYAYLYRHKDIIEAKFEDLVLNRFESLAAINAEIEKVLNDLSYEIRKAKIEEEGNAYIDFNESSFTDKLNEIINEIKKPTRYLRSGIIKLNQMLNGGFQSGRLYLFLGITGGFKSGILLNILYWIKKYNLNYETKDPNKTPTILYITQENSLQETIERLWSIGCSKKDMKEVSNKKILKLFQSENFILSAESNINIRIMYKANKSISTDDLYSIYDDLSDEGQEVVCLIHDYTKRIRPASPTGELRIDLGNVIDEETVFAKTKNIPVITAAQLNRKAMEIIEEATNAGKKNAIDKLGASNVGESWAMLENADWVGIINVDSIPDKNKPDAEPKKFITIKQLKIRSKRPSVFNSFVQPFEEENGMKIIDDVELGKSASIDSLETFAGGIPTDRSGFSKETKKRNVNTTSRRQRKLEDIDTEVTDDLGEDFS